MKKLFIAAAGFIFLIASCGKEEIIETKYPDIGSNPFDAIGNEPDNPVNPDSASITGLHKFILSPVCANGACHDGTFEPDFRTVQSSYSTLVFHPVTKNNASETFTYRVVPFDTEMSVLHERVTNCCFVNSGDIMPQSSQEQMPQKNINAIEEWIMNGAPNAAGVVASQPPSDGPFLFDLGFTPWSGKVEFSFTHLITAREGGLFYNPLLVDKNDTLDLWFDIRDINTSGDTLYGNDPSLMDWEIAFSKDNTFQTGVTKFPMEVTPNAFGYPVPSGNDINYFVHYIDLDGLPYNIGDEVYFKIFVNDGDHAQPVEIFDANAPWYFQGIFSIKIQ